MKTSAVIMAGGVGERFWPMSRIKRPKQFLPLVHEEKTMIRQTVDRILPLVKKEDILVATNARYKTLTHQQLPELCVENILCEPMGRNTAACIGLAAAILEKRVGDCVMLVLSSDHLIVDEDDFREVMTKAIGVAEKDENIVTIGISPTYPETGFGYIHFDAEKELIKGVYDVRKFVEKPDLGTAMTYLATGEYLWNSGMFVFKVSTIMAQFKRFMPKLYAGLQRIARAVDTPSYDAVLREAFETFDSVSIDYGVMEHAKNIYTVPGNFGWDDVGSWTAVGRIREKDQDGNALRGDVLTIDTHGCTVYGGKRLVVTMGIDDLVIVDADDVLMVCKKDQAQQVKTILEALRNKGRIDLL
jgi:mannose-1-phosphate guanylyltransferase